MYIRATYGTHRMHTYMHVCIRAVNVYARKCMYMHVSDFIEAVYRLDWSSMCPYSQHIRADTDTLLGTPYARICTYMHVFLSAFWRKYVHTHAVTVALRSPAPAQVSAFLPRGRYGKFVAQQRKRRQIAKFNQIRSARLISAQPAPNLDRHASAVPWQSW